MIKNGQMLQGKLADALKTGEVSYQAAHAASKSIDWYDDDVKATKELNLMVAGLKLFIADMGDFESAAVGVQRKAAAAVR